MAGKVSYTIVAEDDKAQRQVNKFFYNMEKRSKESSQGIQRMNDRWAKMGKTIMGLAGAGGAIGIFTQAIAAARREMEELEKTRRKAMQTQLTAQQFRAQAMENAPNTSPERMDTMQQRIGKIPNTTRRQNWKLISQLMSSRGAASIEQVESAGKTASRFAARTGEDPTTRGGAILDVLNITGKESGKAAMGSLLQYKAETPIASTEKVFSRIGDITSMARRKGVDYETAREAGASFATLMQDKQGEKSATAAQNFVQRIMDLDPTKNTPFWERLSNLQDRYQKMSPEEQKALRKKIGGSAQAKTSIAGLLRGDDEAMNVVSNIRKNITKMGPETADYTKRELENMSTPLLKVAGSFKSTSDELQNLNRQGAMWNRLKEGYTNIIQALESKGYHERQLREKGYKWSTVVEQEDPIRYINNKLQTIKEDLLREKEWSSAGAGSRWLHKKTGGLIGDPEMGIKVKNEAYAPEQGQAIAQLISDLRDVIKENTDASREQTEAEREKTAGTTVPTQQTGAEAVNN